MTHRMPALKRSNRGPQILKFTLLHRQSLNTDISFLSFPFLYLSTCVVGHRTKDLYLRGLQADLVLQPSALRHAVPFAVRAPPRILRPHAVLRDGAPSSALSSAPEERAPHDLEALGRVQAPRKPLRRRAQSRWKPGESNGSFHSLTSIPLIHCVSSPSWVTLIFMEA